MPSPGTPPCSRAGPSSRAGRGLPRARPHALVVPLGRLSTADAELYGLPDQTEGRDADADDRLRFEAPLQALEPQRSLARDRDVRAALARALGAAGLDLGAGRPGDLHAGEDRALAVVVARGPNRGEGLHQAGPRRRSRLWLIVERRG